MALDSWLTKVKSAITTGIDSVRSTMAPDSNKKPTVGILAFEIAALMSKLIHLWRSLSDSQVSRLHRDAIAQLGVRKVVSDDDSFLLSLACAELADALRLAARSVSDLARRCADPELRRFGPAFKEFAESGSDPNRWAMGWKEMDARAKKMDRCVASTAALYKEIDDLSEAEHSLRKLIQAGIKTGGKIAAVADAQQKIFWQRQEVKYVKQTSLWACGFDTAISLLARSCFTILARIRHVFGIGVGSADERGQQIYAPALPRSLSAVVYPSSEMTLRCPAKGLLGLSSAMMEPPESTLGAAALAVQYANVVVVIEKMLRAPARAVGAEAREDLYAMLTASVKGELRRRLRGVGWGAARDAGLAAEWRAALDRIFEWLGPLAHNTIRWQGERSFERRSAAAPRANVLMLQTLYFANSEKVEAAIAELLVGLNYVWRFEMEMCLGFDS